jgi:hypothetical protein
MVNPLAQLMQKEAEKQSLQLLAHGRHCLLVESG